MPIIQPTPIDQLPQPPNPADRSNFNSLAYPFTAAMLPLTEQINQAISDTYNNALEAEAKASEASVSAGEAHDSELAAQSAEELAEGHKNAAAISAGEAGDSEDTAVNAAGQATLARDKAQQWATSTGIVEGDLKGSRGYAQDAAQSAAEAAQSASGDIAPSIHAATAKTTPADADEFPIVDSAASWSLKKLTWGNLKASVWAAFKVIATGGSAKATLGLGTAATRDVGTNSGNVMEVGAFGLGVSYAPPLVSDLNSAMTTGFYRAIFTTLNQPDGATYGAVLVKVYEVGTKNIVQEYTSTGNTNNSRFFYRAFNTTLNTWDDWREILHTGNILTTTGQSAEFPMTQKAVTDAIANIDVSGPRPTKDHGAVATVGSQTVVCNVQESDFHMMSMETANTTGTLTIDFANMPDTAGKHFSWHVRLQRGARKTVAFAQTISWAGGVAPTFGSDLNSQDLMLFYKVGSETIRGMVIDAW